MKRSLSRGFRGAGAAILGVAVALAGTAVMTSANAQSRPDTSTAIRPQVGVGQAAAVPKGFEADSITWLTPEQGWVLGRAACATKTCSYVIGTTDGGKIWSLDATINAPILERAGDTGKAGVTEIRFATAEVGWVFGSDLFRTTNGGRSWTSMTIPGQGKLVLGLAANSTTAYALVSPCGWEAPGACSSHPVTFWRTASLTGSSWVLSLNLPNSGAGGVSVYGKTVYVTVPLGGSAASTSGSAATGPRDGGAPNKFYASTDGLHFTARPVPCTPASYTSLIQAVPSSATDVTLLCAGNAATGTIEKYVYRSTNTGTTYGSASEAPVEGISAELAVSPSGNLAVGAWSAATYMFIKDTGKTSWTTVIVKGAPEGWSDLVYVSDNEAWAVYGPLTFGTVPVGQLFFTTDAGQHWSTATL